MQIMDLEYNALKAYQRLHRDHFPENLNLRVHRALSWLSKAEQATFNQLYTLRNQIIYGGTTYNCQVNREQLKDACNLLNKLIPLIIALMMSAPDQLWGEGCYPVVI